jgi:hypothetical protein
MGSVESERQVIGAGWGPPVVDSRYWGVLERSFGHCVVIWL